MEKKDYKKLQKKLTYKTENIALTRPEELEKAGKFAEGYKDFLNHGKIEREVTNETLELAKKRGYKEFDRTKRYEAGEKIYAVNRGKNIILTTFGTAPLSAGVHFNIAHIDSPRLDLKPNPLYEKTELAYFKTHYYGGIRKYQWGVTPLAMHGRVMLKDGKSLDFTLGENEGDPVFVVTDLLPHLASEQNERKLKDGLKGEELNILVGSVPVPDEDIKESFKLHVLELLNEKYGITEKDFLRAELTMVPAVHAQDVGFDHSMVGAYGQDDKVCAYAAVMAELDTKKPEHTTVTLLTDKEEIGSEGNTGMASDMLLHYMEDLCMKEEIPVRDVLRNSICLSADVNSAYDPNFADVFDERNSSYLNHGPVFTKYTGARGKSGSNDASAETMQRVISYMDDADVLWQFGELGKVDIGGGGTIAHFIADMDVDTVDLGVAVLAMHSPFEITSKIDLYYTYKAFLAFNP